MEILVIGGNGFLGQFVIQELLALNVDPISFDIIPPPRSIAHLSQNVQFVRGNIMQPTELVRVCREYDVKRVIHLPSLKMAASQQDPLAAYELNVKGMLHVLEVAAILNLERVVCASSVAVYSPDAAPLQTEDAATNPATVYGMTKLAAEHLGATYARERGVSFIALRPTRLYGPGRTEGALEENIIATLRHEQYRWRGYEAVEALYVADGAQAFALTAVADLPPYRVFNICSAQKYTARQIFEALAKIIPNITLAEPLPSDPPVGALQPRLASRRAETELDWRPQTSLEEGLTSLVKWLRQEETI